MHVRLMVGIVALSVSSPGAGAQTAAAQPPARPRTLSDSSAEYLIGLTERAGTSGWSFLARAIRDTAATDPAKRRILADWLVEIAVAERPNPGSWRSREPAMNAIVPLVSAGRAAGSGRPLDDAQERLTRIHRESKDQIIRGLALSWLTAVPQHAAALVYLRSVATSGDPSASAAVTALIREAMYGGMSENPQAQRDSAWVVLRELRASGAVTEYWAALELGRFAHGINWVP